jgi:uncharacterized membrane protein YfhO|tara:strand:- start:2412 stop:2714 length:303 start_codon:yes stop_codon:yes gene_type:complete
MSYSKDYEEIRTIIDDIIGVETQVGNNLKTAIKKYFEMKPVSVKLVSPESKITYSNIRTESSMIKEVSKEADEAMARYNKKLREETKSLKEKGEYCGISG